MRKAGGMTGPRYCAGTHIHISADDYTPRQIRNLVNIFASKENFLWEALQVSSYHGRMDEQFQHYSNSRYVICNMHSFFQRGHYEIKAYSGSLHAGEVRSQIVLALAISNAAMAKKYCSPHISQSDNMRYSFRVWLLNLRLIGEKFKNCHSYLLKYLEGNIALQHFEDSVSQRERLKHERIVQREQAQAKLL